MKLLRNFLNWFEVESWTRYDRGRRTILSRTSVPPARLYQDYFARAPFTLNEFCEIWHELCDCLRLPEDRVRPRDRFDGELGYIAETPVHSEIMADLERKLWGLVPRAERRKSTEIRFENLQEIVIFFARHQRATFRPGSRARVDTPGGSGSPPRARLTAPPISRNGERQRTMTP